MLNLKVPKESLGLYRVMAMPSLETSRVWRCTVCGAKLFHCKTVSRPQYQCLCGGEQWDLPAKGVN
jgi:hypothetical protein